MYFIRYRLSALEAEHFQIWFFIWYYFWSATAEQQVRKKVWSIKISIGLYKSAWLILIIYRYYHFLIIICKSFIIFSFVLFEYRLL